MRRFRPFNSRTSLSRTYECHSMNVEYNIPYALWLRKARILHARKEQEFGKLHPQDSEAVASLREQCRQTIVSSLTLENLHCVSTLPLPTYLKNYISNLDINEDFSLHAEDMEDPASFAYKTAKHYMDHLHHTKHYIFPTRFLYDNKEVLIKVFHNVCNWCDNKCCEIELHDLKVFQTARHPNLQTCYATTVGIEEPSTYFVIEKSVMNFRRLWSILAARELLLPKHLIWKLFHDIVSIVNYFFRNHSCALTVNLDSFTISPRGKLQLENPLLTLPEDVHHLSNQTWSVGGDYQTQESSIVSSLGSVLLQLVTMKQHANILVKDAIKQKSIKDIVNQKPSTWFAHLKSRKPPQFAKHDPLPKLIKKCLRTKPSRRPSLAKLLHKVKRYTHLEADDGLEELNGIVLQIPQIQRYQKGYDFWWKYSPAPRVLA